MDPVQERELDEELGLWLNRQFKETFAQESETWAIERIQRVSENLQAGRPPERRFQVEILWVDQMTAFITPGRFIYITRELLQSLASDDPVALILAHEMAHYDLGHLDLFRGRWETLRLLPGGAILAAGLRLAQNRTFSVEHEEAADIRALKKCLSAGYDGLRCLELFDVLEAHSLDYGDVEGVFGPSDASVTDTTGPLGWLTQARSWIKRHTHTHPAIRERKEALAARLLTLQDKSSR